MRWFWIDRFLEFESGRYAKAIKCVSLAEDYLHDHFPHFPIFPNSLVIEGLAQTGGLLVCEHNQFTEKVILAKLPKVQFFCPARPGDTLTYMATIDYQNAEGAAVSATSHIGDRLQAQAEIVFAHLNAPWLGTFFSPEAFLSMMRVFGAYRVGHAADGSPLVPPERLCKAAAMATTGSQPTRRKEGNHETTCRHHRRRHGHALGADREGVWKRLLAGESGVGYTTLFDAANFPTKYLRRGPQLGPLRRGREPCTTGSIRVATPVLPWGPPRRPSATPVCKTPRIDPTRFGVYTGSGEGQQDFDRFTEMMVAGLNGGTTLDIGRFTRKGLELLNPIAELEQEPNMPAGHLAGLFDAQGPNINCLTACAASSQAIGEAVEIIRRGEADVMLAGGTHTMIHPFGVTGFNLLTALSTRNDEPARASRPFDRDRDGFVLGEGAGMVVLEELEIAKARGARIYGEVVGYGSTADAFRITDTHPEGAAPSVACGWPWPTPGWAPTTSTTSTPTAPALR